MNQKLTILWTIIALCCLALAACGTTDKKLIVDSDVSEELLPEDASQEVAGDCQQACEDKQCGQVGECDCGSCAEGETCNDKFVCEKEGPACEAVCEAFSIECGPFNECECGDCEVGFACSADGLCEVDPCVEKCADRECGEMDGCVCGSCGQEEECGEDGLCFVVVPPCEEECTDIECGAVGDCECGDCEDDFACVGNACVEKSDPCVDVCEGKECGDFKAPDDGDCDCGTCTDGFYCNEDGMCIEESTSCDDLCSDLDCGMAEECDCGECGENETCTDNECIPDVIDPCADACEGQECGDDNGCFCGVCTFGQCVGGACACVPNCGEIECGPDGCGGSCGECPGSQVCAWDGKCHNDCDPAQIPFSEDVQKIVSLVFGDGGYQGEALDVDNNPGTCAPSGNCEGGLDNSLAGLFGQIEMFIDVNAQMMTAVEDGSLCMLAEMLGPKYDGTPFTINMFMGGPILPKGQCNFQTQTCNYEVFAEGIDGESCKPVMWFDNATVVEGYLHAGGPEYKFSMMLAFFPGAPLIVTLDMAQIAGDVVLSPNGAIMTLDNGVIGGALAKEKLMAAVDNMPDDIGLPISKDMIKNLLNLFITNDMDANGDGDYESASTGMKFNSIEGNISGIAL